MAVRHAGRPHVGVQFHPESILTGTTETRESGDALSLTIGKRMIRNFIERVADQPDVERPGERQ
jgi:anthranilate synthase component 2